MGSVHVGLNMTNTSTIQATVVQFYDIDVSSSQLILHHQQVYQTLPSRIDYSHSYVYAPSIGLLKIYENFTSPKYFLVYHWASTTAINITSIPQHCPHASSLLSENINNQSTPSVFFYHQICRNSIDTFCFHDENYLCFCQLDHYGAECFNHNTEHDRCNNCLSNGKCIQGDLNDPNDFLCICPPDYYGHVCEFHSKPIENTTRPYFSGTKKSVQSSYISLMFLFLIIAFAYN
jgi:hypothetical protein